MTYQTAADESYLIGTKGQLLAFANSIIEATKDAKVDDFAGEDVLVYHFETRVLDNRGEVGIDEIVVVDSNEKKERIFRQIQN